MADEPKIYGHRLDELTVCSECGVVHSNNPSKCPLCKHKQQISPH